MFQGIHHIEYYVGNAYTASYFFRRIFGLRPLGQAGLETGARDRQSFAVGQKDLRLVFTNALDSSGTIAEHVRVHGDAIRDIALAVTDASAAFERCLEHGAEPVAEPHSLSDDHGQVRRAIVRTFGDTVHSLIERGRYAGALIPEFQPWRPGVAGRPNQLVSVDHVACCVEPGALAKWMDFYESAFGFEEIHHEDIVTDLSAMNSKVIGSPDGSVKLPLMEPAPAKGKSQIEEFLEYHEGPGAQHVAFLSTDLLATVRDLRADGALEFLDTPDTYYEALPERVGELEEDLDALRELNVLADRDRWGYLLQVFTRPVTGRPTSFLEIIQRRGARGFGGGNVRALFEAVERAQAARGNLF